jgi:hypothetical protein
LRVHRSPVASIDWTRALGDVVRQWADHNNLQPHRVPAIERPDLGIEIDF